MDAGPAMNESKNRAARLIAVRAYDRAGMCLYELGDVGEGVDAVTGLLHRALGDDRTDFVNVHTARPGCLLCQVERTD